MILFTSQKISLSLRECHLALNVGGFKNSLNSFFSRVSLFFKTGTFFTNEKVLSHLSRSKITLLSKDLAQNKVEEVVAPLFTKLARIFPKRVSEIQLIKNSFLRKPEVKREEPVTLKLDLKKAIGAVSQDSIPEVESLILEDDCSQYKYKVKDKLNGAQQACTFHALEALYYMKANTQLIIKAFNKKDVGFLSAMQKEIMDLGFKSRQIALESGMEDNAQNPEDFASIEPLKLRFSGLSFKGIETVTVFQNPEIEKQIDRLFQEKSKGALVVAGGESLAIFPVSSTHAFIFDSHYSRFFACTKQGAKHFLEDFKGQGNAGFALDFYHNQ